MSLKSGTNSFHGTGYEFFRRKWLDANSFLLNARSTPKVDHYLDQYGFEVDGPVKIPGLYNGTNKTFFMFNGEKYREGTPARAVQHACRRAAMKNGDFSRLVDAQGRPIIIYDPATGRDVNGVWTRDPFPGNIIPANRINPAAKAIMQDYPDPNCTTAGQRHWQQNLCYTEHFNKDLFWNWVGKVDHNFSQNDRIVLPLGEERAQRGPQHQRDSQRPGPERPAAARPRATTRVVGDWVHVFGGGTVFNVRGSYTYLPGGQPVRLAFGFDATQFGGPRASSSQFPAAEVGGMFPVVTLGRVRAAVARLRAEHEQELHDPAEHLDDARQAQHPQRSRHALDQRLQRELRQRRRTDRLHPQLHAQHAEQHQRARRQLLRVVPARRTVRAATCLSTCSRTTSGSSSRRGSRTTGASTTS